MEQQEIQLVLSSVNEAFGRRRNETRVSAQRTRVEIILKLAELCKLNRGQILNWYCSRKVIYHKDSDIFIARSYYWSESELSLSWSDKCLIKDTINLSVVSFFLHAQRNE